MNDNRRFWRRPHIQKLTVFASALTLLSGCGNKSDMVINENAFDKDKGNSADNNIVNVEKPNIVYIVLDDSGYSDIGSYGSEIKTPNLDFLAENGLRYSNFHVTPVCSPTRAALLTGRNPHSFGMATVANFDMGEKYSNKRGRIYPEAGTIAETLEGYNSYALGKWHLGPSHEATPAGPYNNWPLGKGFDRFYGYLEDSTDQYRPELVQDNSFIKISTNEKYHFSEDIVEKANQYVTDHASVSPEKPFFLYLAFGAQHQPVQVPQEYIDMYEGVYDKGWDKIRLERFNRQKELGIIPKDTEFAPLNPGVSPWNELSVEKKEAFTKFQQAYAGFLTHTDEQIGKFIDNLKKTGELDNTMIVFLSDNGASAMGKSTGSINHTLAYNDIAEDIKDIVTNKELIGSDETKSEFPQGWAQVSNTPFKMYKSTMYEAGIRTPLVVYYPKAIKTPGEIRHQFVHVIDITPTVYEIAGVTVPKQINGVDQMALHGTSILSTFNKENANGKSTQYFENNGQRAIYKDGWKAIALHQKGTPYKEDVWQLYHVENDINELNNLAKSNTKKLVEMQRLFDKEAGKYGVNPMSDVMGDGFLFIPKDSLRARNTFTFYEGMSHLPEGAAPFILNRSYSITVPIIRDSQNDSGVLVALGSSESGYTLYIKDNLLVYEYNRGNATYKIVSDQPIPKGETTIRFEFDARENYAGKGSLFIDNKKVGSVDISETHKFKVSFEGLDIGKDSNYPVSEEYNHLGEFKFTGEIEKVEFQLN